MVAGRLIRPAHGIIAGVWWFYTVVLGMAFGKILEELAVGVRDWTQDRGRRPFFPVMLWRTFLLILIVQVWLAVTYYRGAVTEVSILEMAAFLIVPAGIMIMTFLLPETGSDHDTAAWAFGRVRSVFFAVLIAMVGVNLAHGFLIGHQSWDIDLLFQVLIVAGAVAGLLVRSARADTVLAAAMIVAVITYIGVGYSTVVVDDFA